MTRQTIAWLLTAAVVTSGCASTSENRISPAPVDNRRARVEMAEYVARLPVGSRVRIERTQGGTIKGTLMSAGPDRVVVQRATRIPEPPVEIPLDRVTRIGIEDRSSVAKIALFSAAVGAAATVGFLFLLASILSD